MAEERREYLEGAKNADGVRAQRITEAKGVPVEKTVGRKPIGPPPLRVNPAPQTQPSSSADSQTGPKNSGS